MPFATSVRPIEAHELALANTDARPHSTQHGQAISMAPPRQWRTRRPRTQFSCSGGNLRMTPTLTQRPQGRIVGLARLLWKLVARWLHSPGAGPIQGRWGRILQINLSWTGRCISMYPPAVTAGLARPAQPSNAAFDFVTPMLVMRPSAPNAPLPPARGRAWRLERAARVCERALPHEMCENGPPLHVLFLFSLQPILFGLPSPPTVT